MAAPEEEAEMEPEIPLPQQDAEMKVRKDYVRVKKAAGQRMMQRCPITGQLIPVEEMSNHLKILLLDPKRKHQQDALVERARKEAAFADDVEANLAAFVAKRPDLFGSVDEQIREAAACGRQTVSSTGRGGDGGDGGGGTESGGCPASHPDDDRHLLHVRGNVIFHHGSCPGTHRVTSWLALTL